MPSHPIPCGKTIEEFFPWNETKDQLRCVEEIKRDMESDIIMDRLLCGDVDMVRPSSVKSRIQSRDGWKTVCVSCSNYGIGLSTFLTILKRFAHFPVTVEMLSRFRTASEQKNNERLKIRRIDVVVGTHKLFNKEVRFKDLGLLVIDEEQRFGVDIRKR